MIDFRKVIDELWETSKEEMDFEKEAQHLERFYENQKDVAYVTCPKVYKEYSNEHLLVMSYVDGIQIDHIEELDRNGYDRKEIAQKTAHKTIVNRFWRMVFFMQIHIQGIYGLVVVRSYGLILEWQVIYLNITVDHETCDHSYS